MNPNEIDAAEIQLNRFRAFVTNLYALTAGGPPVSELLDAITADNVDMNAVHCLISGFPFNSYTREPTSSSDIKMPNEKQIPPPEGIGRVQQMIQCEIVGDEADVNTKVYHLGPDGMQRLADTLNTRLVSTNVLKGPYDTQKIRNILIKNDIK